MKKRTVVVTGGSGYLGGAACARLLQKGYHPISLDRVAPPKPASWEHHLVDLSDEKAARRLWDGLPEVSAVLHFAALALVAESMEIPEEYRRNNVQATRHCVEGAARRGARAFVHSSTCAVYGYPETQPITEETALAPINPYGESKQLSEKVVDGLSREKGLRALNLRYFNPAGALDGLAWGERHEPETHLIPLVFRAARTGEPVSIFGSDYPTPDGTCVRDFLHLEDLIEAHILALDALESGASLPPALNLGAGRGHSVREILDTASKVCGKKISSVPRPRRAGAPPTLVADTTKANHYLRWKPTRTLEQTLASHWAWETSR
jgi:UDP-glucose 4-epimerase